ncbi:MAG: uroporphyrinogen-III C-methyltransferase [Acidobacteriaceae bacterium]|nr:uroporphyrinogen-III C-methyltransferase [Acidobacteriaceae bacterium]
MAAEVQRGKLYLIGAGPGDAELLTLGAVRALARCDVVLYDRLVSPEVLSYAQPGAELIYVGKHEGDQDRTQARIFDLIRDRAYAGKTVARLKGGDPLIFGRGAEEWARALEEGIEVELIPGLSSALAVPALAGIPLTYRGVSSSLAVVTGHCCAIDVNAWAKHAAVDTLVVLMGVTNRQSAATALIRAGRNPDEPVAFIERGTLASERVIEATLAGVASGEVEVASPAVWVIGEVVQLRGKLRATAQESPEPVLEPQA